MPSSLAAELASLDASLALLAAERVADRRLSGVRGGEWSCARFSTPPTGAAKTHLMAALADDVSAALERHTGAPAFLAYGTLLGALRERDLLEWSGDVDLTVSAAQAAQLARGPLHADLAARGIAPFFAPRGSGAGGIWRLCATPRHPAAAALAPTGTWGDAAQPAAPQLPLAWEAMWKEMDRAPYVDVYAFAPAAQERRRRGRPGARLAARAAAARRLGAPDGPPDGARRQPVGERRAHARALLPAAHRRAPRAAVRHPAEGGVDPRPALRRLAHRAQVRARRDGRVPARVERGGRQDFFVKPGGSAA